MNIEKILNSVLTDTAPVKPMKICHYKDVEIFFNDSQRSQQPCIYFMKGTCNKGSECSYSHSLIDSTPRNNKYKTTLCDNWKMQGKCRFGDGCSYAHGEHQLRKR